MFTFHSVWYILYTVSLLINFVNVVLYCVVTKKRAKYDQSLYNVSNQESINLKKQLFLLNIGFFVLCLLNLLWFSLFPTISLKIKCVPGTLTRWTPDSSLSAAYIWIKTILSIAAPMIFWWTFFILAPGNYT